MGLTFKGNCLDIRNSKEFDIFEKLKDYRCHIQTFIPGLILLKVQREHYPDHFDEMSRGDAVIIDIKGIVKNPSWRL